MAKLERLGEGVIKVEEEDSLILVDGEVVEPKILLKGLVGVPNGLGREE